jgi:hypothetical protein
MERLRRETPRKSEEEEKGEEAAEQVRVRNKASCRQEEGEGGRESVCVSVFRVLVGVG